MDPTVANIWHIPGNCEPGILANDQSCVLPLLNYTSEDWKIPILLVVVGQYAVGKENFNAVYSIYLALLARSMLDVAHRGPLKILPEQQI